MEDPALNQRNLDDKIANYEIQLAKMREQRQLKFTVIMFFVVAMPIIAFLSIANYGLLIGFITAIVSFFIGKIIMITHNGNYRRLLNLYDAAVQKMIPTNKGG